MLNTETEKVTMGVIGTDDFKGSFTLVESERKSEVSALIFVSAECEH